MPRRKFPPPHGFRRALRGGDKDPGTLVVDPGEVTLVGFDRLPEGQRRAVADLLCEVEGLKLPDNGPPGIIDLVTRRYVPRHRPDARLDMAEMLGRRLALASSADRPESKSRRVSGRQRPRLQGPINFKEVEIRAHALADRISAERDVISRLLGEYECRNVILDEIRRSVDHLTNLHHNRHYFQFRVGLVKAYMPSNQPLYALVCYGIVPSFMAAEVLIRPPAGMGSLPYRLAEHLLLSSFATNLKLRSTEHAAFTDERREEADAVIFTGTPRRARQVRSMYPPETLFILNGAGHNPVVVTESADIGLAVRRATRLCLMNQGQDCAAPNSILVHSSQLAEFRRLMSQQLERVKDRVGPSQDPRNIVGPNTRPADIPRIAALFHENGRWLAYGGEIHPARALIQPTAFIRPLEEGAWLKEFFAPVVMVQPYRSDGDLAAYFEHPDYAGNAMYVTVFGHSPYVRSLVGSGLHIRSTVLENTDLHREERGWRAYGGLGEDASSLFIGGRRLPGPTLPQRDIYLYLVQPQAERAVTEHG